MTRSAKVLLHWLYRPSDESPFGQHFSRPARFGRREDDWTGDAWSLVVDVKGRPDDRGYQDGTVMFLMPTAPQALLSVGEKFTLFDGRLAVAEGEVKRILRERKATRRESMEARGQ